MYSRFNLFSKRLTIGVKQFLHIVDIQISLVFVWCILNIYYLMEITFQYISHMLVFVATYMVRAKMHYYESLQAKLQFRYWLL